MRTAVFIVLCCFVGAAAGQGRASFGARDAAWLLSKCESAAVADKRTCSVYVTAVLDVVIADKLVSAKAPDNCIVPTAEQGVQALKQFIGRHGDLVGAQAAPSLRLAVETAFDESCE